MPRRSLEALHTPSIRRSTALHPRSDCPENVRRVFDELVASVPADHFRRSDTPLLEQYAQAIVMARQAYERLEADGPVNAQGRASAWLVVHEKATRAAVALSLRLRLAPQTRMTTRTAGRK